MDWYQGEDKECAAADGFPNQDLYYPILYQSEFWIAFGSLKEINGSMKDSELNVNYEPVAVSSSRHLNFALTFHVWYSHSMDLFWNIKIWKWKLQSQTEENWRKQEAFIGEEYQGNDMLRNMLLDTNPCLLGVTAIISMLHAVFDILEFKNDTRWVWMYFLYKSESIYLIPTSSFLVSFLSLAFSKTKSLW